jgi:hypothetical protein
LRVVALDALTSDDAGAPRTDASADGHGQFNCPTDRPRNERLDNALIARLESKNDFLSQQVERQNHIIAGLIQRVPLTHEIAAGEIITVEQEKTEGDESAESADATVAANFGLQRDETRETILDLEPES